MIVHAGEDAALRPTSDARIGPGYTMHYSTTFANIFTEVLLMALADTLHQGSAIRDEKRPEIKGFVDGFANYGHAPEGAVRKLALHLQVDTLRRLQVVTFYQNGWDLSPGGVEEDTPPGWVEGRSGHAETDLVKYLRSTSARLSFLSWRKVNTPLSSRTSTCRMTPRTITPGTSRRS